MYAHAKIPHIKDPMAEFGGSWKQQNNPGCSKSASRVFKLLVLDTMQKRLTGTRSICQSAEYTDVNENVSLSS